MSLPSMATQAHWNFMIAHTRIPNDRYTCRVDSKLTNKLDQPNWNYLPTWRTCRRSCCRDEPEEVDDHERVPEC